MKENIGQMKRLILIFLKIKYIHKYVGFFFIMIMIKLRKINELNDKSSTTMNNDSVVLISKTDKKSKKEKKGKKEKKEKKKKNKKHDKREKK